MFKSVFCLLVPLALIVLQVHAQDEQQSIGIIDYTDEDPPNITPFPTITPEGEASWRCRCNGKTVEAETREECEAKSEGCNVEEFSTALGKVKFWCRCLKKQIYSRRWCCDCEEKKCKCYADWWKRPKKYGGHKAFRHCNRVCRRNKC